jgi:hypothetical protein
MLAVYGDERIRSWPALLRRAGRCSGVAHATRRREANEADDGNLRLPQEYLLSIVRL